MATVKWEKTNFKGLEFYKHADRKHGVKFDRYFRGRFTVNGISKTVGLGWASGGWTEEKAVLKLNEYRENMKTGTGPTSPKEEEAAAREAAERKRAEEEAAAKAATLEAERLGREAITVSTFWNDHYFPGVKVDKAAETVRAEERNFRNWISPQIGDIPIKEVKPSDIEKIKNSMLNAPPPKSRKKAKTNKKGKPLKQEDRTQNKTSPVGRSPRLIEYVLAITRQLMNHAERLGFRQGDNPCRHVKKPKVANERKRFLTHAEADELLAALKERTPQLHDMAILSLRTGLRAGEIFNLQWADVDFQREQLLVRDPKGAPDRHAYLTAEVKETLKRQPRTVNTPSELVFKSRKGGKIKAVSNAFDRAILRLGLNDGITDRRHKLTFHSLRHSFASQLVEAGISLPVVKELLGHSTLRMTERYSHVGPGLARKAIQSLDAAAKASKTQGKVIPFDKAAGGEK
jgi:integrase